MVKRAEVPPGMLPLPPIDTRNTRGVKNALPAFGEWEGMGGVLEYGPADFHLLGEIKRKRFFTLVLYEAMLLIWLILTMKIL